MTYRGLNDDNRSKFSLKFQPLERWTGWIGRIGVISDCKSQSIKVKTIWPLESNNPGISRNYYFFIASTIISKYRRVCSLVSHEWNTSNSFRGLHPNLSDSLVWWNFPKIHCIWRSAFSSNLSPSLCYPIANKQFKPVNIPWWITYINLSHVSKHCRIIKIFKVICCIMWWISINCSPNKFAFCCWCWCKVIPW